MATAPANVPVEERGRRLYRTIWRWHFYAGIFCIPLVIWLSITGSIYLFKPQIERWMDRPYNRLHLTGPRATPEQIARTAVIAVPGSTLHYYELPPSDDAAVRVIVGMGKKEYRVYVNPQTLAILHTISEDQRFMTVIQHLHGELLVGTPGSYLVELAASWAIVLLLTGLYLWWPRQTEKLAGVLWIRTRSGSRIFWRDLHAVTGVWISALALFLILTGLPWAKGWGGYFKKVRQVTGTSVAKQDWTISRADALNDRMAQNSNSLSNAMDDMPGMDHSGHMGHYMDGMDMGTDPYQPFNVLVPVAATLHLAAPVEIMPAMKTGGTWTIKSDAQNRTLRDVLQANPETGAIVSRKNFNQGMILDRIVGTGIAAHEGQLFGLMNQLLGLITAMGLVLLCVSAVVVWWRRRYVGVLGAPLPLARPRWSFGLVAAVVALAIYLPAMAFSLIAILLLEWTVLSRVPSVSRWLGLTAMA
ncbi:PepSY domain-containing protein [Terriglobus sp. TAA 43]|uniref:PepSY-associated TM helix domain-containing protein n=1 Tax=Terriglobus sp. TAA 43 TaxID=278961 RepID=UPI0006479E0F|nr:PepSY domain-containing protein [Terriglobus sp. TAA 43]